MKVNGEMMTLARDFRAMGQEDLGLRVGISQAQVAKLEAGLKREIDDELGARLARALGFPASFFEQEAELLGFGSSAYFYRKKATIPAPERKRIHSIVNLLRIALKKLLPHVEVEPKRGLPQWDIDDYGYSAANVAKALRAHWHLPDGPVRDLTLLVESAGVIVIPCDFGSGAVDATSLRLADMPPMVFMNTSVPGDRWRFTLAHELAHLVMHREPHDQMEEEADAFAGEFLVPADEVRPQLARVAKLQVRDLIALKRHWRVSMQALIFRAFEAGAITEAHKKSLFVRMSQLHMRQTEPEPIEKELPSNLARMLATMTNVLAFSVAEVADVVNWGVEDLRLLLPVAGKPEIRHLRAV